MGETNEKDREAAHGLVWDYIGKWDLLPSPRQQDLMAEAIAKALSRARAAGRDAGLEEAAKVCDERATRYEPRARNYNREIKLTALEAEACAASIRDQIVRATPAASGNGATDG